MRVLQCTLAHVLAAYRSRGRRMPEPVAAFYTLHLLAIVQTCALDAVLSCLDSQFLMPFLSLSAIGSFSLHASGFAHCALHPRSLLVRHHEQLDATVSGTFPVAFVFLTRG